MSKKDLLAALFFYTGILKIVGVWGRLFKNSAIILAYHRVLPEWDEQYPGDLELISASTGDFDWQMSYLKKHFNICSFPQLSRMSHDKEGHGGAVIVTFDDGFVDNYEHALPVLQKYQLPATIFVTVGYIGQDKTFWFERISEQLKILQNQVIHFPMLELRLDLNGGYDAYNLAFTQLLEVLKSVPDSVRLEAIEYLNLLTDKSSLKVDNISRALTWAELKALRDSNVSIEPHTYTHPALSNCSADELRYELAESKLEIEEHLGGECKFFSYPFGGEDSCNPKILSELENTGYEFACTYTPAGGNILGDLKPYQLMRIHVERYTTKARFVASLVLPKVFN